MIQASNTNLQAPEKHQDSSFKGPRSGAKRFFKFLLLKLLWNRKAPGSNLQARTPKAFGAEKHQTPSFKSRRLFEIWGLDLLWSLELGVWSFARRLVRSLRPVRSARFTVVVLLPTLAFAQDRLKTMPAYEQAQRWSRELTNVVKLGNLSVTWKDEGKAFEYRKEGKRYRYDIATGNSEEVGAGTTNATSETGDERRGGGRRGNR